MKKTLLASILAGIVAFSINAQNVNIPDANFKSYLVNNSAIDINNDDEIQVSEAQAFSGTIQCDNLNINDLTGIESFTNITELICHNNQLTSINVSNNTALTTLDCHENQLTSLDVSNNTSLINLGFDDNQLTTIDLSAITTLEALFCEFNQLTGLDLSNNTALKSLYCNNNQLSELNVANGNNNNFTNINASNNSSLTCIEVDDAAYSNANWTGANFQFDGGMSFSEDCSVATGVNKADFKNIMSFYPNPANSYLKIQIQKNSNVKIVDYLGNTIASQNLSEGENIIDVSFLSPGVYFLQTEKGSSVIFVKK